METKILSVEHINTQIKSVYGGQKVMVTYLMKTTQNNVKNSYTILAEVRGITTTDLHLNVDEVTNHNNNEETLVDTSVMDLFDDYVI